MLPAACLTGLLSSLPVLSSRIADWDHLTLAEYHCDGPCEIDLPAITHHSIVCRLGQPFTLVQKRSGRSDRRVACPDTFSLCPAGEPNYAHWESRTHTLHVRLEAGWAANICLEAGSAERVTETGGSFGDTDPQILHIALALKAEMESDNPSGPLYRESLATGLAVYLLKSFGAGWPRFKDYPRGLGKSELDRVLSLINDRLADDLSLAELSACAHLSSYHFARLFKQSTGLPPHEYIIRQRIEKAKRLLLAGRMTVGEVAQAVGFFDNSNLYRHFKRLTGTTPRLFRCR